MWTCQRCNAIDEDDSKEFCFECMTPRKIVDKPSQTSNPPKPPSAIYKGLSAVFLILSFIVGCGASQYSFKDAGIVGGDAYNYIIGAGRGTALVGLAIIFAIASLVFAVYDLTNIIIYYNKLKGKRD